MYASELFTIFVHMFSLQYHEYFALTLGTNPRCFCFKRVEDLRYTPCRMTVAVRLYQHKRVLPTCNAPLCVPPCQHGGKCLPNNKCECPTVRVPQEYADLCLKEGVTLPPLGTHVTTGDRCEVCAPNWAAGYNDHGGSTSHSHIKVPLETVYFSPLSQWEKGAWLPPGTSCQCWTGVPFLPRIPYQPCHYVC